MGTVHHHQNDCYSADCTEYHANAKIAASDKRLNNERCPKRITVKPNRSEEKEESPNARWSGLLMLQRRRPEVLHCAKFARLQECSPTNLFLPNEASSLPQVGLSDKRVRQRQAESPGFLPPETATAIQQARTIHSELKARRTVDRLRRRSPEPLS